MPTKGKPIIPESYQMVLVADNATNGDVIKAMFPDAEVTDHFISGTIGKIIYVRLVEYQEMRVQEDWWNALYKGGCKVGRENILEKTSADPC